MRPILRSSVAAWASPPTLDFSGTRDAATIQKVFGTSAPLTADGLSLWDDDISGARVLNADERRALEAIQARVATHYRTANSYLLDSVGAYCAYCELPLHDPIQVEHVLPKSQYPTFALSWDNFLPACIGCNSRKREAPLRSTAASWLAPQPDTPSACRSLIRTQRYRWPDLDPVEGFFSVCLLTNDGSGWRRVSDADSVDSGVREVSTSISAGEVRAHLPSLALFDVPVAALVEEITGDRRSRATIDLCVLDRLPKSGDAADRRTIYRTQAWLRAVECLGPLHVGGLPPQLPPVISTLIETGGFFWVWLSVARLLDPALRDLLVSAVKARLPGTDGTRLP